MPVMADSCSIEMSDWFLIMAILFFIIFPKKLVR